MVNKKATTNYTLSTNKQGVETSCSNAWLATRPLPRCAIFWTICELILINNHSNVSTVTRSLHKKEIVIDMRRLRFADTDQKQGLLTLRTQISQSGKNEFHSVKFRRDEKSTTKYAVYYSNTLIIFSLLWSKFNDC